MLAITRIFADREEEEMMEIKYVLDQNFQPRSEAGEDSAVT